MHKFKQICRYFKNQGKATLSLKFPLRLFVCQAILLAY